MAPCVYMPETIKDPIDRVWGLCRRGCRQQGRQPWPVSSSVCVFCEIMRPRRDRCGKDKYSCSASKWAFLKGQRCSKLLGAPAGLPVPSDGHLGREERSSSGAQKRAIARHEVREIEQRHTVDGPRQDVTLDEEDDVVIIYNRVPKTASTSFTNIAYDLCAKNKYHVLHINTTKNNPVMSLQDQVRFVKNVTSWKEMKPGFYHGHISYLDFAKFGVKKKPIYINVIRDPIERLVSYYYFLRFGDDYRPGLRRRKQGDKKTFDECVAAGGSDCAPEKLWLQIPFFCGHSSECWNVGSRWALEQAKYNLINEYFLVGVTEELEDFIMLLEAALPRFFRGATELYRTGKKSHLRKTTEKKLPTKETIAKLQQSEIWKMENEFYEFALEQFQFVRAHAVREKDGELYILAQNFFYEKIYPKSN
ncbi:PREDICTED: heparan sulfate 2-O-sulfotransferase 1 [Aptenodytes forsteri]|uniref:heparan sulfate 2-O-sulfotransferase 1 n=1 Tax=Aptenodytes forsteri TaxID=9233 RepID=UPI0004F4AF96|nr:PREDICTED: heparan sulfate 2-O-sulfotransferase 1 [Aptenodytes forsteri]